MLRDYSTTTKIRIPKDLLADSLVYTVAYTFLDKKTPGRALPFIRIREQISFNVCTQNLFI